jgi:hypothetical protein
MTSSPRFPYTCPDPSASTIVSSPSLPSIVSAPVALLITSLPSRADISSASSVPIMTSSLLVPSIILPSLLPVIVRFSGVRGSSETASEVTSSFIISLLSSSKSFESAHALGYDRMPAETDNITNKTDNIIRIFRHSTNMSTYTMHINSYHINTTASTVSLIKV